MASDCQEGNRRGYNISGDQTSGKEEYTMWWRLYVCMYTWYRIYLIKKRDLSLPFFL